MHPDPALRERQRDAAGADAQLESGPVAGEAGEEVDDGIDGRRLEQVGGRPVVRLCNALAEMILRHGRTLPKS